MFPGVMALFERSMRIDARAWAAHLARFGLMAAIYTALVSAVHSGRSVGAPGLHFFRFIIYLDLIFMSLLGISFFSTPITEEKEEDTLGLMLMAGISPLGILIGKSGGRLIQALLLIAVQYPFTLLAVTMGGITPAQVRSSYMAMAAFLVLLAGAGLLCSTLARRNSSASIRLLILLVLYWFIPLCCTEYLSVASTMSPFIESIVTETAQSCVFHQLGNILSTGSQESFWSVQVVSNLVIGGICFVLSWVLFGQADRESFTEAYIRGPVARSIGRSRWLSPGRPRRFPFIWKDFHFIAGGTAFLFVRFAFYVAIYPAAFLMANGLFGGGWGSSADESTTTLFLTLTILALAVDAALLVSRSLHQEVRSQTLTALLMLPTSTGRILYAKIAGSLLGWLPGIASLYFGMMTLPEGIKLTLKFLFGNDQAESAWIIALLLLIPHLAAILAMYVRWGAVPLAVGLVIGEVALTVMIFPSKPTGDVFYVMVMGILTVCGACHLAVYLKTERLASR